MSRRRASKAERAEALDLAERVGFAEAGRRLGIPDGTLRSWANRATSRAVAALAVVPPSTSDVAVPDVAGLAWPERRARLLPKLGEVAAKALEKADQAIDGGKARDAKDYTVTAAILVDKAQLLGGGATSRSESTTVKIDATSQREVAEQVAAMRHELGYADADIVDAEVVDDGA